MADEFLTSPVLPGQAAGHHEHRRLLTVLLIVVLLAIGIFFTVWWSNLNFQTPITGPVAVDEKSQIIAALQSVKYEATPQEKNKMISDLKKSKTTVSISDKEELIKTLRNSN